MKKVMLLLTILALMISAAALAAPDTPGTATYTIYVVDQNGDPVPDCSIGMCVDTGCMPIEADEKGVATYTGAPQKFHLKVIDAPEGYDYPDDTDIYVGPDSGEQTLTITKESAPITGKSPLAAIAERNAPASATYTIYVVDQDGNPVPDCSIGMCVDTGCMPIEANEDGVAVYTGAPQKFHLKVIDAPDGYDYPDDTDIYVGPESGSQTLTITKE